MKLNYTLASAPGRAGRARATESPSAVRSPRPWSISLHGHLAPVAWAAAQARPGLRLGFVQGAGRGAARARSRATSPSCASASCSAATSPPGPPTAASTRRSASSAALDAAARRLGWEAIVVGPGPGILGSATRLGPRRHGRARRRPRRARARAADAALPAALELRRARSPPRPQPPHRVGARAAAGAGAGAGPGGRARGLAAARRGGPRGRLGAGGARRADRALRRAPRPRGRARSTSTATRQAACRRGRWAGSIAEDPLFFAAPLAAGRALAAAVERVGARAMERIASKTVYEGPIVDVRDRRAFATTTARPPSARSSSIPAPSAIVAHDDETSTWCASRASRSDEPALLELPRASSTSRARRPLECAQRELVEEIGDARARRGAS